MIGCSSQKLRRRALRDNPTLKEFLDAERAEETSQVQAKTVGKQSFQDINAITSTREKDNPSRRDTRRFQNQRQSASKARFKRRILHAPNAIQTMHNEEAYLIIYCLNCIRCMQNSTFETGLIPGINNNIQKNFG